MAKQAEEVEKVKLEILTPEGDGDPENLMLDCYAQWHYDKLQGKKRGECRAYSTKKVE